MQRGQRAASRRGSGKETPELSRNGLEAQLLVLGFHQRVGDRRTGMPRNLRVGSTSHSGLGHLRILIAAIPESTRACGTGKSTSSDYEIPVTGSRVGPKWWQLR